MTGTQGRVDVYVRTRNVLRAGMRTFQVGDEITLDYQTDHHGVERLAGVEVLGARGVEVDGLDVATGRPHGTGPEWIAPASPVPARPGVARLLARCDEIEQRNPDVYGPAVLDVDEVRALLAGGEQQHGHVLRKVWKGDDGKDQRGPWVACPTCGPAPEADHVPDAADPTATPTEEIR